MLFYFVLGILFALLGIPILDALSSIVSTLSEYISYIFAFKIYKIKSQIQSDKEGQQETRVIGFSMSSDQDQYYEDEQEEDCFKGC